ncbi:MAG TPA: TonB-dependent receptor [Pricia sp.]|nr:TonB-dependent receptor [Pricia sp.]
MITVSGTVSDDQGVPLPGASIVQKETSNGVTSDFDGNYTITLPTNSILVFSYIGMESQEISVDSQTDIDVRLKPSATGLDEVVVIGYGTESRRTLTTAVAKVDGSLLETIPISNVGEGLKGKVSGARIYSNNTAPGADPIIRIRGGSSINKSNAPLVLIDGVELGLSDINPNDIASIEVLKDAASSAIYGSRASNGVVLVTTKQGAGNRQPQITFEATTALQGYERFYDFLNAEDYISIVRPAVLNSPFPERNFQSGYSASSGNDATSIYTTRYLEAGETVPDGWKSMIDPIDNTKTLIFQDNSIKDILFKNAVWKNYYVGINGGNEVLRYSGSAGYTKDDGIALASNWERFSTRANIDAHISEKLKIGTNFSFTESNTEEHYNQRNVIARGLSTAPTHRLFWDDGTPAPGYNNLAPTPLWNDYTRDDARKEQRTVLGATFDWNLVDRLHAKVNSSYFIRTWQRDFFMRAHEFDGSRPSETYFSQDTQKKLEAYFSYDKTFGNHSLAAVAGYSYLNFNYKDVLGRASGASTDKIPTLNAAPQKTDASSEMHEEVLIGYFGRLSYDFKKKYLMSATFRRDGSSRFLPDNRWGFFPSGSVGWIISEEPFLNKIDALSNLKLRASYGQTGNNQVGRYDAQGLYSVDSRYNENAGIRAVSMPNANLGWETSTQLDIGFDLGLFNNRINIIADYFDKRTEDLIFSKPLPNTSGFSNVDTNIGTVKFYGFDFEVSTENVKTDNFEWSSSLIWSYVKNEVLELPDNDRYKNRIGGVVLDPNDSSLDYGGIAEGEPLYRYYGYQVDHIIQDQAEADNAHFDNQSRGFSPLDGERIKGRKFPGDYEWVDRNNDGIIDSKDQFELGVTVPHTTGGFSNFFKYKNLSLNVFLDFALGHSINDSAYMRFFMNTFAYNYALVEQVKDTWSPNNPNATYARITANDPGDGSQNFERTSSAFNFDADYLCLREVTLNYQIPKEVYDDLGVANASVYVSGNNLHYFTSLIGTSPEMGTSTTYSNNDYNNYPAVRKISLGVKLTF